MVAFKGQKCISRLSIYVLNACPWETSTIARLQHVQVGLQSLRQVLQLCSSQATTFTVESAAAMAAAAVQLQQLQLAALSSPTNAATMSPALSCNLWHLHQHLLRQQRPLLTQLNQKGSRPGSHDVGMAHTMTVFPFTLAQHNQSDACLV